MKTDLLQSCGHRWVFQIYWHIECSTFTPSSFMIWNRSTEIPSPPLALFIVMLPEATWLRSPGCLALGEWSYHRGYLVMKIFYVQFCVFLPLLLNIFCFWYVRMISVLYWANLCMKCSLGISNFLEDISSLPHSFFFPSIALHWSLWMAFLSLLAILQNSAFRWEYLSFSPLPFTSLLCTAVCKASSDNHFAFCHFFFLDVPDPCLLYNVTKLCPYFFRPSVYRSNSLNLFLTSTI